MDGKTEVPDFIAHAKGVNTGTWQDATKQYAMRKAEIQGRTWKEADKQFALKSTGTLMPSGKF